MGRCSRRRLGSRYRARSRRGRRRSRRGCLLLAALIIPCAACVDSRGAGGDAETRLISDGPTSRDLLLVTVDTLRADRVGLYGYDRPTSPRIDEWFDAGTVFEAAYSTDASTSPSVVSMLTGLLPQDHGVRLLYQRLSPAIPTVADWLGESGYQTAAVVSNVVLTAEAIGLDQRFGYYDDYVDEREPHRPIFERRASRTTDAAVYWLTQVRDSERPSFLWVHYIDPHGPYRPPEDKPIDFDHDAEQPVDPKRIPDYVREPGLSDASEYMDRYDEEIAYTDREVGRLLDVFADVTTDVDPLVLFTADHGESMTEHELWFRHGHHVYEEVTRVPLLALGAGFEPERVTVPVSNADVAATLLAAAGFRHSGIYARDLRSPDPQRPVFSESSDAGKQWRAMWLGHDKWMVRLGRSNSAFARWSRNLLRTYAFTSVVEHERRYYDLEADPRELHPRDWGSDVRSGPLTALVAADPLPAGRPLALGDLAGSQIEAPKVAPGVDPETIEKLRALGYALIGLSPLMALVGLLIKLEDRGPILFVQERVGLRGRPFSCVKFRTMIVGAEHQGRGIEIAADDQRITRVGAVLRRWTLDEIPQLHASAHSVRRCPAPRPGLPRTPGGARTAEL